jgi:hypothetical protein
MALSPTAMAQIDFILESTSRKIWRLSKCSPRAFLHSTAEEIGLNIPTVWEDYCGAAVRSWTQILNDEGTLGVAARASLHRAAYKFQHWPLELDFHIKGGRPLCPSITARNMATLVAADLHPLGGPDIWSGNEISRSLSTRIPILLDEDGCPEEEQPFPSPTSLLHHLVPLWEHNLHSWGQLLGRAADGRPYFHTDHEL